MDISDLIKNLENDLTKNANPQKSIEMGAYMKNKFSFYGVQAPLRREILKNYLPEIKKMPIKEISSLVNQLWDKSQRELNYISIDILEKTYKNWDEKIIETFEYMSKNNQWWDSIDPISSKLIGKYFLLFPQSKKQKVKEYSQSNDFWLNRIAILFQLGYGESTDKELLFSIIKKHTVSDEFFIQKSIGWALRQYSYKNKEAVIDFIENNSLKPLSKREGLKAINRSMIS